MALYLNQLKTRTAERGGDSDILIVQSNGGVMSLDAAAWQPVRTALSGPAAGVIAARHIGQSAGFDNVITCDMGGTSFDVSVIADGKTALAAQTSIDFGMVVRTPMIEITTIGAGGGSIAWIDGAGLLQIGPQSAGSDPGPVCYGLGNDQPTVTDANLLLGRINADRPIGGKLDRLDVEAARAAIQRVIAEPLGIDVMDAAEAIIQVANARMAGAIRIVSIERGHDPAKFAAMPFGGGGALHIGALIREVGLNTGLVPRYPGVTSALGCVIADMRHDTVRTVNLPLAQLDEAQLRAWIDDLYAASSARIASGSETFDQLEEAIEADMLYAGQTHTVQVQLGGRDALTRDGLTAAFADAYRMQIGAPLEGIPVRLVNLRLAVIARRDKLDLRVMAPVDGLTAESTRTGTRDIYADGQWQQAGIYDRLALGVGEHIAGPALLEQADTTIYIDPGLVGDVDEFGNLRIERAG
ncbi:MAG: Acetophenone carboxylase gamma subunit [SAR116 cluster bacterium]|nr:MAG: Acetophenone carboxylase gamma subunit [SAR116 cluster bacterium]